MHAPRRPRGWEGGEDAASPLATGLQGQGCRQRPLAESASQEHTVWLQVPRTSNASARISASLRAGMCADRHVEKESKEVCPPQESLSSLEGKVTPL